MLSIDFAYEETCSTCNGIGTLSRWNSYKDDYERMSCPFCDGTGQKPTSIGNALLNFLARHHDRIAVGKGAIPDGYDAYKQVADFKSGNDTDDQGGVIPS